MHFRNEQVMVPLGIFTIYGIDFACALCLDEYLHPKGLCS